MPFFKACQIQIVHAVVYIFFNVDLTVAVVNSSQGIPVLGHVIAPSRGGKDEVASTVANVAAGMGAPWYETV